MSGVNLLLSDARGVYIPANFVECFDMQQWHITEKYYGYLSSPDNEEYWEAWEQVLNYAYLIDDNGNKWQLWQDGDLWAYCFELMTQDEKENFGFEDV